VPIAHAQTAAIIGWKAHVDRGEGIILEAGILHGECGGQQSARQADKTQAYTGIAYQAIRHRRAHIAVGGLQVIDRLGNINTADLVVKVVVKEARIEGARITGQAVIQRDFGADTFFRTQFRVAGHGVLIIITLINGAREICKRQL
jgi:hypothetical protein